MSDRDIVKTFPSCTVVFQNEGRLSLDMHSHEEHQVIIPLRGDISFATAEHSLIQVGLGRMAMIPASLSHSFHVDKNKGERLILYVHPQVWSLGDAKDTVLPAKGRRVNSQPDNGRIGIVYAKLL